MKRHIAIIASLCLFQMGYAQKFELVTEFEYKSIPYAESIYKFESPDDGIVFQYSESARGGIQANADLIYVSNEGQAVQLFKQTGKAYSRPDYFEVGDVNAGKLVLYNPNASQVILQIIDLENANTNGELRPDFSSISVYEKITRTGLESMVGTLSWKHSYEVESIFDDHIVLKITSNKKTKHYNNPAIIHFDKPNVLKAVNPSLPPDEEGKSDIKPIWNYQGSSANRHFYFRGYAQKKKGQGQAPCTSNVAVVDNSGKVVNTFSIDMTMPGLKIVKYNNEKDGEGRNANLIDYKVEQCIYMLAMGEDDKRNINLIVKKVSFDGKLIWEKSIPVVKYKEFKEHFLNSITLRYDYDDAPVFSIYDYEYVIDPATGDLRAEINMSNPASPTLDRYPHLDKNIKAKCETFKKANKDLMKINFIKKVDNTWFVLFECKKDMGKVYKFTTD